MGELIIPKGGDRPIRGIYSPEVQRIAESLGRVHVMRASHVEPTSELSPAAIEKLDPQYTQVIPVYGAPLEVRPEFANKWWADMLPVDGPVLGPFEDRDTALATEAQWLRDHNIPVCDRCRTQIEPPTSPVLTEDQL